MTLLTFEGFDHFGTTQALASDLFATTAGWSIPDTTNITMSGAGLLGGLTLGNVGNQSKNITYTTGLTSTELIVGIRYLQSDWLFVGTPVTILQFMDGSSIQCGLSVNSSKKLIVWRGTTATVLATGITTMVNGAWYYFECRVVFSNTGSFDVHLGGVSEIASGTVDTTNTANQSSTGVRLTLQGLTPTRYDDFYICDQNGSAPYNTYLGVIRVETVFVSTDNSVTWTPLASTNASQVDETQCDGDTTYNSTINNGDIDTFNHGALSSTPDDIFAVSVDFVARKDDVLAKLVRTKLISGGTTSDGTSNQIPTIYQNYKDIYINDPDTAAAWAGAAVNATKIGYELV